eukprot:1139176-Pelagomonas_calceolata.AAC.7
MHSLCEQRILACHKACEIRVCRIACCDPCVSEGSLPVTKLCGVLACHIACCNPCVTYCSCNLCLSHCLWDPCVPQRQCFFCRCGILVCHKDSASSAGVGSLCATKTVLLLQVGFCISLPARAGVLLSGASHTSRPSLDTCNILLGTLPNILPTPDSWGLGKVGSHCIKNTCHSTAGPPDPQGRLFKLPFYSAAAHPHTLRWW